MAGGHTTTTPTSVVYLSVVLHDSVHLAFLIAALMVLILCVVTWRMCT